MKTDDIRQHIYVDEEANATFKCPDCGLIKKAAVHKFRHQNSHLLKVKCSCKSIFTVQLDFRQKYRKKISLFGRYLPLPKGERWQEIKVNDISMTGIGFTVHNNHNIDSGQKLIVRFTLDNPKQSQIEKKAIVRKILGNRIGCEFLDLHHYEKTLGFYLLN